MTPTRAGSTPHEPTAVVVSDHGDAVLIELDGTARHIAPSSLGTELATLERDRQPRWIWWSKHTARRLVDVGVRPARCWDLAAVHRLLVGGWRSSPAHVWAAASGLDRADIPEIEPIDLFNHDADRGDLDQPIDPSGHVRPEWAAGDWQATADRRERWARLAVEAYRRQTESVAAVPDRPALASTVASESAAELLCAELEFDGLPFDPAVAERIIASFIGPRPHTPDAAAAEIERRDHDVLRHLPAGARYDLRSPDQVRSLLRRVGIEVPDTRAWRLEALRDAHPIVEPLLEWRRAERILTTFGYAWIDEHVTTTAEGVARLRGSWSSSDGAAGRMTATAGLHNMPAELRPAIAADPGWAFVRADLGQIEPRILAAVSGDTKLAAATHDDDMYAPVAAQLDVERDIAKVAVLGAMYGQTTGKGAEALGRLERAYPVAMGYLADADRAAQGRRELRTHGGRRLPMGSSASGGVDDETNERDERSRAAARGRYGRNAMVQGAAAEFFKMWAVIMRARAAPLGARVVLCLHDELLVHAPADTADDAAALLDSCLQETADRWRPPSAGPVVRFVSDTSVISDWSQAK